MRGTESHTLHEELLTNLIASCGEKVYFLYIDLCHPSKSTVQVPVDDLTPTYMWIAPDELSGLLKKMDMKSGRRPGDIWEEL